MHIIRKCNMIPWYDLKTVAGHSLELDNTFIYAYLNLIKCITYVYIIDYSYTTIPSLTTQERNKNIRITNNSCFTYYLIKYAAIALEKVSWILRKEECITINIFIIKYNCICARRLLFIKCEISHCYSGKTNPLFRRFARTENVYANNIILLYYTEETNRKIRILYYVKKKCTILLYYTIAVVPVNIFFFCCVV